MNLYEWEGKQMFKKYGIATPKGVVVSSADSLEQVRLDYLSLGVKDVVVKAQVLAGKRGKNNGIKFCSNLAEVETAVIELLAKNINGQYVESVLIEEKLDIDAEHYVSITYDTNKKQPVLIYSSEGGMDIEYVNEQNIKNVGLNVRNNVVVETRLIASLQNVCQNVYNCFLAEDCRVAEINPLVKTKSGTWLAADAKIAIDDDAFFVTPNGQHLPRGL